MAALLQECKEEEEEESASAGDSHRNCLASLSKWGLPLVIDHKTNDPTCHAIEDLRGLYRLLEFVRCEGCSSLEPCCKRLRYGLLPTCITRPLLSFDHRSNLA